MDDEAREAIEELRGELEALRRARTPAAQREARHDVAEAREDLDDVLRREYGGRVSRRKIEQLLDADEEATFRRRLDAYLEELAATEEEAGEEEGSSEEEGGDGDGAKGKGSSSSSTRRRIGAAAGRRKGSGSSSGDGAGDEEAEEWK